MSPRPQPSKHSEIHSLIEDELYSKSKIKPLEEYLQLQVRIYKGGSSCEAPCLSLESCLESI